jgi:hypothetical protein
VWDKLGSVIRLERQQLRRLLDEYRPLFDKCAAHPRNLTELSAFASVLHFFYNLDLFLQAGNSGKFSETI